MGFAALFTRALKKPPSQAGTGQSRIEENYKTTSKQHQKKGNTFFGPPPYLNRQFLPSPSACANLDILLQSNVKVNFLAHFQVSNGFFAARRPIFALFRR
jgi:hypothetical protein